ncbi:MAG: hypothetical protein OXI38_12870 [Bacteroidota bacterium]|nr:hypothetical protein [Bacteroidota bacterium]
MNPTKLQVLITVKTYPIPSSTYDELVCTAGVTENGDFIRLYPINFRELAEHQQYRKYQWIELDAVKHTGRDKRKESFRPITESIVVRGDPIPTHRGSWSERGQYVLAKKTRSMEDLWDRQAADHTSLGVFRPKEVQDLVISPDDTDWKPSFKAELRQQRIWEDRTVSREPLRKVPFKFHYRFSCDDSRCRGHKMMIEDWEVGALFWRLADQGTSHEEASELVKQKFLRELCGGDKDSHFFVGTVLNYPRSWIVLGVFYPKKQQPTLFD